MNQVNIHEVPNAGQIVALAVIILYSNCKTKQGSLLGRTCVYRVPFAQGHLLYTD